MNINKDKRKEEIDKIETLKIEFMTIRDKLENIKFKTIHIGNKTIECDIKTREELKNDNILVL